MRRWRPLEADRPTKFSDKVASRAKEVSPVRLFPRIASEHRRILCELPAAKSAKIPIAWDQDTIATEGDWIHEDGKQTGLQSLRFTPS
jgi:hypothetical protein